MAAGWRHTSAVITGPNVSAVIQSAARLERGRTLNNGFGWTQLDHIWHAGGREGGREGRAGREGGQGRAWQGRGGEGRGGEGRGGEGRGGEGRGGQGEGRGGQGRGGQGRAGQGGEGRGLSTLSTNQNICDRGA